MTQSFKGYVDLVYVFFRFIGDLEDVAWLHWARAEVRACVDAWHRTDT